MLLNFVNNNRKNCTISSKHTATVVDSWNIKHIEIFTVNALEKYYWWNSSIILRKWLMRIVDLLQFWQKKAMTKSRNKIFGVKSLCTRLLTFVRRFWRDFLKSWIKSIKILCCISSLFTNIYFLLTTIQFSWILSNY